VGVYQLGNKQVIEEIPQLKNYPEIIRAGERNDTRLIVINLD